MSWFNWFLIGGYGLILVFVWAPCRAAARGDR